MGNLLGSITAAVIITFLPEILRVLTSTGCLFTLWRLSL